MPADPGLRLNGENFQVTVLVGGTPFGQSQILKSFNVEPVVTEHNDPFIGSDADDPDFQVRGWTFEAEAFVVDTALNDVLLDRAAKMVARQPYDPIAIAIVAEQRDGTNKGYFLQRVEIPPMGIKGTGAAERVMQGLKGRAKYFKPASI